MEMLREPAHSVRVDGKFFRVGCARYHVKGISYGPFSPDDHPAGFASLAQTRIDFDLLRELGANVVRVYHLPPTWFLDLAAAQGLRVFIDVPWPKHLCFLGSRLLEQEARRQVRDAATLCRGHPGVFALSVVNEIPADIARWSGARKVAKFVDELAEEVKSVDADRLVTFTNFPPTEYLESKHCDFVCFNVYLHHQNTFDLYLSRLQMLAGERPLVLGEFGMDSLREGERQKCEFLAWQIKLACRRGLAGTFVFSFTDDWYRGGLPVDGWEFGLTHRDRTRKPSFHAVCKAFAQAPYFPLPRTPRVSVVVASYNGARTLEQCLKSLMQLNYPDYEIILVNDGSTDDTVEIAGRFPSVVAIHQTNCGLSAARNAGIVAASGEIIAFTDSDCRADEDWLYHLIGDLLDFGVTGIGGHNLLPPDDSCVAATVMASPGGPAHVMITDREAEHIPGCNMAFFKTALESIGGFDTVFVKAGDDVDVCWRLQQSGRKIGFSPSGFVWHYRRSTVNAYLRQQSGYGEADALLARKHPNYFNLLGGGIWRGRIYATGRPGVLLQPPLIHHGVFGSSFFQRVYTSPPSLPLMLCTSVEYYVLIVLPAVVLAWTLRFTWIVPIALLLLPLGICTAAALQAEIPRHQRRFWSRALVASLFLLQPLERGLARYRCRLNTPARYRIKLPSREQLETVPTPAGGLLELAFWSPRSLDRYEILSALIGQLQQVGWQTKTDSGWSNYDAELLGFRWARARVITAAESLEKGATTLRWRLEARWTLEALVHFWAIIGLELLLIGAVANSQPWIWMTLLTIPLLAFFFEQKQVQCLRYLAANVGSIAERFGMVPVWGSKPIERPAEGMRNSKTEQVSAVFIERDSTT